MKSQIFIPNEFQSEAQKKIEESILKGEKAALIVIPTGTGKTYLAAQWSRSLLEKNPKVRLLYVCHNQDILSQANDKEFANCLSEFDIPRGYYNKSEKNVGQITFATVQTLIRNLNKLPSDYFDYIIVDEAHHYRAKGFEKAIKHFSPKFLLGLTATPNRMDGRSLEDVFGRTIYSASISNGIKNGLLSKMKYYCVDNDIDFSDMKLDSHGRYDEKDLNKKICVKEYDDAIIKEYIKTIKQEYNRKKTICFCATVEHTYRMEKLFNDNGIKAVALTGKRFTEKGKEATIHRGRREQIISMFKGGDYDIIFVRDLFNEGMDIPDADCIMMLRPTESSRIFTQQIGRGLRVWKGKNYLLALDFTGNCHRCDINYEVLSEILDFDIEKDVKDKIRNNNPSEIIIQNIGCEVRLSKRKIDVIKDSEEKIITKEKLIENYFNVKNKLGRQPGAEDFNKDTNGFSLYCTSTYIRYFGSWNDFLKSINEKYFGHIPTEQELIDNYLEVKEKLGRQPLAREMRLDISLFDESKYTKHFGSWFDFLSKVGDVPLNYISEEDLIKNYLDVKKELGKAPSGRDIQKYGKFSYLTYVKRFGSWNNFLSKMGETTIDRKIIDVTEEDLIKNYLDVKKELNKVPTSTEIDEYGTFGIHAYIKTFGSWNNFLLKMGEKIINVNITEEDLIENYLNVKKELNKVPTTKEMGTHGRFGHHLYDRRFGSWNNFLSKMGDNIKDVNIAEEDFIENYSNVKKELGRVPAYREMDIYGRFKCDTYDRKFGSWKKFMESMEEKAVYSRITEDELIDNYFELKSKYPNLTQNMVTKKYGSRFDLSVYADRFGSWNKFLEKIGEEIKHRRRISTEELIKNYLDLRSKYPDLTSGMVTKENGSKFDVSTYYRHFGSWIKFLEIVNQKLGTDNGKKGMYKENITIVQDYIPKNPLPTSNFEKSGTKSRINARELSGYRYGGSDNKDKIRHNIIDKIRDDDVVLMLESPELGALKEIDKQGKHPKKIIIPNHIEFDEVAEALKGYNTNLNIELINTSVLQYIADHPEEHLNFLWLDYCGAFSYYARDLEAIFQRKIMDMKLILTYNIFDPKKQDDSYYFTNVIGYVLKKLCGKNEILLMEDVSQRYKKTMFSVGFDIKKSA